MTAPKSKQLSLYRHPFVSAELVCFVCSYTMHDHYWIDGLEGAECICPPPQHTNDELKVGGEDMRGVRVGFAWDW